MNDNDAMQNATWYATSDATEAAAWDATTTVIHPATRVAGWSSIFRVILDTTSASTQDAARDVIREFANE
jgi:hypothetical protein